MTAIPQNMERYLTFTIGQFRFIDSIQFMSSSIEDLAKTLTPNELKCSKEAFPLPEQFELVQQKGVNPCHYFDNKDKFNDTKLPSKEILYNKRITIYICLSVCLSVYFFVYLCVRMHLGNT